MTYTRRAATMAILGSGTLLAARTLGSPATEIDRQASIDTADDADAYLGLVARGDGIETGGVLFEADRSRSAPAAVTIANQLTEPVAVTLSSAADRLQFRRLGAGASECGVRTLDLPALEPGTAHTVALSPLDPLEPATDDVAFLARSETGAMTAAARRPVSLESAGIAVLSDSYYQTVLTRRLRPGSIGITVVDEHSAKRLHCTQVTLPGFQRGRDVLVRVERSPSIDSPTASVATDDGQTGSPTGTFDRDRSAVSATVRTAAGVTATVGTAVAESRSDASTAYAVRVTGGGSSGGDPSSVVTVRVPAVSL